MIEAVIFDMDGLLIDSEPLWVKAEIEAFKKVGLPLTEQDTLQTKGRRLDEVVAYWYARRPWEGVSQKDVEALVVDKIIELIKKEGQLMAGAISVLDFFKARNIPMVIASSSSSEIIDTVVDTLGIRSYFVELFSAEHESHGKPHPGVFITTAAHLKVDPSKCLVFEDSPLGVLAAKSAHMLCVAVPDADQYDHPFINIADKKLKSLEYVEEEVLSALSEQVS